MDFCITSITEEYSENCLQYTLLYAYICHTGRLQVRRSVCGRQRSIMQSVELLNMYDERRVIKWINVPLPFLHKKRARFTAVVWSRGSYSLTVLNPVA